MQSSNLTNHFLIAMPGLADPNFEKTVTYVCAHNEDGAMGITINRPLDLVLEEVLQQMQLEATTEAIANTVVYQGGPVQIDRGFVLHNPRSGWDSSISISQHIDMTTSRDVLKAIAEGEGPEDCLIALGYSGWGAGQLENEIRQNAWLSGPANSDIIFRTPVHQRWEMAARALGVDLDLISSDVGHA
jgi:putative transcriptional regulator